MRPQVRTPAEANQGPLGGRSRPRAVPWWRELILVAAPYAVYDWCGATIFRLTSRRWLRVLAVAYPVLTALVVLGTANHYLADVVAGAGLWVLADFGVRHLSRAESTIARGAVSETPHE